MAAGAEGGALPALEALQVGAPPHYSRAPLRSTRTFSTCEASVRQGEAAAYAQPVLAPQQGRATSSARTRARKRGSANAAASAATSSGSRHACLPSLRP